VFNTSICCKEGILAKSYSNAYPMLEEPKEVKKFKSILKKIIII